MYNLTNFKDHEGLAKLLTWLIWVDIVLSVIGVLSSVFEFQLLGRIGAREFASQEALMGAADANDARQRTIGLVQLVAFAAAGIASLRWIYLASGNAHALAGRPLQVTQKWAVGWYFVPVMSWWKPYQAMTEIASVSSQGVRARAPELSLWWAAWITSNISASLAFNIQRYASEIPGLMWGTTFWIVSDAASLAADLLFLGIIQAITNLQLNGYEARRTTQQTAAQPA